MFDLKTLAVIKKIHEPSGGLDGKSWKAIKLWPLAACEGPTGIAYDRSSDRIFVGCGKISVVVDGTSGKVVAMIRNGDRVDALGWVERGLTQAAT